MPLVGQRILASSGIRYGGKHDLAEKIIALMPKCLNYVEPYAGGLSVLLRRDPEGVSEVVNDLNSDLSNFWCVLQSEDTFAKFQRIVEATPFSEREFQWANDHNIAGPDVVPHIMHAVAFFIHCRQSLAGRMKSFTGITKTRTRRGMNNEVSAWLSCIEGLPAVHERLKRVLILNRDALKVIRDFDGKDTLLYLDPPYHHSTRKTTKDYEFEMTDLEHVELLNVLESVQGKFVLSGYHSDLYDTVAERNGWKLHEIKINNHAAGGKTKRVMTECLWCNFDQQGDLFDEKPRQGV